MGEKERNVYDRAELIEAIADAKLDGVEIEEISDDIEIIGVRFNEAGKIYYFDPQGISCKSGDQVVVDTARGFELGVVVVENKTVGSDEIVPPLRVVERIAAADDIERHEQNLSLARDAFALCNQKIQEHGLEMKLIDAKYTFDNSKLIFKFSAEKRIDFRELVKDLASVFKTRIELIQIGIRDEAKLMGGLGPCGRPFCCSTFLSDFAHVTIKMAKEQNLSLNSTKISGTCGRLMCCLRFEHEAYEDEIRTMPRVDARVKTPDGDGVVTEISPLTHLVKVRFIDKNETVTFKTYDKNDVSPIEKTK